MDRPYSTAGVLELAAFLLLQGSPAPDPGCQKYPSQQLLRVKSIAFYRQHWEKKTYQSCYKCKHAPWVSQLWEEVCWCPVWRLGSCGPTGPAVTGTSWLLHRAQENTKCNADSWIVTNLALPISANLMSWLPSESSDNCKLELQDIALNQSLKAEYTYQSEF